MFGRRKKDECDLSDLSEDLITRQLKKRVLIGALRANADHLDQITVYLADVVKLSQGTAKEDDHDLIMGGVVVRHVGIAILNNLIGGYRRLGIVDRDIDTLLSQGNLERRMHEFSLQLLDPLRAPYTEEGWDWVTSHEVGLQLRMLRRAFDVYFARHLGD
jgi:hypothetical protein